MQNTKAGNGVKESLGAVLVSGVGGSVARWLLKTKDKFVQGFVSRLQDVVLELSRVNSFLPDSSPRTISLSALEVSTNNFFTSRRSFGCLSFITVGTVADDFLPREGCRLGRSAF